ncbi:hypothetical protein TSAR_001788 [Trichomalopsis sarcophagae]|uniref:ZSWIM1/3 RNaseH-like domain-containing protein n=1 Tax=Trichomalopsis sarcophagae TaxID=543379 RepID=A0A232EFA3_9HYME|nr:hypothetical protein TSAR_001788 [Trichomalopsis sarcophagae]
MGKAIINVRSLKVNCPARIRLQASRNGRLLQISHVSLNHENHLDTNLDPVPESRKMSKEAFEFVLNAINLKSNRACIIQLLKEKFNVTVIPKDLKNIQLKLRAWGETIYFDGTYKLIMHSLIVLIFLVEDGNFLTEIVGVGIVRREDQDTMDWIMSSFKKHHHNNFQIIKYFMSDKNQTQRQAVKKICPNIVLLICLYHTIQIWKRQLSKMNLKKFNVTVIPKDLKNIQLKLRVKEVDQLSATIEFLQKKGAVIDILKEQNTFQGLFFTTPDMIA